MTRELELQDDMKEYWGFYLLKGSTVTVSACVSYPGASLIMIKGYKHLQECAYIGDDSSEEVDELLEANRRGLLSDTMMKEKLQELQKIDGKANQPGAMKRHKSGVSFHDPSNTGNVTSSDTVPTVDVTDQDPNELRAILEHLHALREAAKEESLKHYKPPSHLEAVPGLHRHRDTNVDKDERQWLSFKGIDANSSDHSIETNTVLVKTTTTEHPKSPETSIIEIDKFKNKELNKAIDVKDNTIEIKNEKEEGIGEVTEEKRPENINSTTTVAASVEQVTEVETATDETNSREVFEDVLKRLQALGDKGKKVLVKLHQSMGVPYLEGPITTEDSIMAAVSGSDEELDRLRKVLVEAIDEAKTKSSRQQKRHEARMAARAKRELMLGQIELTKQLNEDDEPRNHAGEEDLKPDSFADDHKKVNETTPFDMSKSEFWSSFSSSEEALLECEGLILNLPLTPHGGCNRNAGDQESFAAARANALTYRVPANGYYFFVFNSENEVQTNYIRARFDLQKTRYDVAKTKLRECTNSTERCDLSLDIFSSQKVVLELPLRDNDSLWNEQFVIITECEPRTSIYLVCVITVPVLIIMFAFQ
ncbi:uncharacterized protein LOC113227254 isoform X2 [Hyposmocoma kahamanoa]|nr:uncharacterized protein LOC113227254 isoform X2 [Hyposmocoma kahamanoa]